MKGGKQPKFKSAGKVTVPMMVPMRPHIRNVASAITLRPTPRAGEPLESRRSPSSMDTCNSRGVTSTMLAPWERIAYLMTEERVNGKRSGSPESSLTGRIQ
ncbi:hypothetical protein EVAR_40211_1 [Eumeta japonica]|uniref:Uncharacterized protein n=1 Tax=Eumeta variegata TaxID=151549 RepID=A0A4C1XBY1_EUMVA|nr:hypothetical protein EVAR_40211_1 [Eumeta japonica]